ncbi:hypothetical protein [Flammeovirga sp. SubArs3]|uniref:hypothetical protein n=1 Tax=Flammeovirga sp. SubArs3 TaxID=2995316 RepID=UPI00248D21BF|nr:hypothetical protein [Flammeovirga sp. SubArs3]
MKYSSLLLFLLISLSTVAQKKVIDFYYDGGRLSNGDDMVYDLLGDVNIHTPECVLTYIKEQSTMKLDFIDDDLKEYNESLENLEAYLVEGEPEIVWRVKKDKSIFVRVYERDGQIYFAWHGRSFEVD